MNQCARDAVAHRTCLAAHPSAYHFDRDIEAVVEIENAQWTAYRLHQGFSREVFVRDTTIDGDQAVATGIEPNACHGRLAPPCAVVIRPLKLRQSMSPLVLAGATPKGPILSRMYVCFCRLMPWQPRPLPA